MNVANNPLHSLADLGKLSLTQNPALPARQPYPTTNSFHVCLVLLLNLPRYSLLLSDTATLVCLVVHSLDT